MQQFSNGKYLGQTTFEIRTNGFIISRNQYHADFSSSWHYHENPHITFILKGGSLEKRRKESIECVPGMLLFYNKQEKHKNELYRKGSKNFSIEFESNWLEKNGVNKNSFKDDFIINDPLIKKSFVKIIQDAHLQKSLLAIEATISDILTGINLSKKNYQTPPTWLHKVKDLLQDPINHPLSLTELANTVKIHPVTISKMFPHFIGYTLGDYIRNRKIEKSISKLCQKHIPLEIIAEECGFADHAHFSRQFKKTKGITPSAYRKLIFS
ncbi:MAG TPA: AraC family transcriptional regulator [Chitinophagaceae bacterium]|nr:AraC family transcriptional regulator [Chitinophagaceae bacterium]